MEKSVCTCNPLVKGKGHCDYCKEILASRIAELLTEADPEVEVEPQDPDQDS